MTSVVSAYYSLSHVARIKPGETVLIDIDSGNSALFFHRVALWLGANPFLYSATDERPYALKSLSNVTVFDARAADFAGILSDTFDIFPIRAWIHPSSIDCDALKKIALQTNAHEVIIDQCDHGAEIADSVSYSSSSYVNPLALAFSAPLLFSKILSELGPYLREYPMGTTNTDLFSGEAMLENLQSALQTEGISTDVLSLENREKIPVQISRKKASFVDSSASYLITGGFGGFGLEVANWLVKQGAKHLILVGRRGAVGKASEAILKRLHDKDVNVMAAAAPEEAIQLQGRLREVAALTTVIAGLRQQYELKKIDEIGDVSWSVLEEPFFTQEDPVNKQYGRNGFLGFVVGAMLVGAWAGLTQRKRSFASGA